MNKTNTHTSIAAHVTAAIESGSPSEDTAHLIAWGKRGANLAAMFDANARDYHTFAYCAKLPGYAKHRAHIEGLQIGRRA